MSNTPWQAVKSHGEIERFKDEHKYIALKITPIIKGKAEPVKIIYSAYRF
jgi:hypothetical protein